MTGEGNIVTLSRKYYVKFSYFDEVSLNQHFSIEEDEEEGIYRTSYKEDAVGKKPVYITNQIDKKRSITSLYLYLITQ